jgi:predicted ribosomally synthesized peptide with nif11-like leader
MVIKEVFLLSIASAKAFIEKMKTDQEFAIKVGKFKTLEEILILTVYDFTQEELAQVIGHLKDSDLNGITVGAFPTAVNDQITESVT